MKILPFKKPNANINSKVLDILKDREFFAISIYRDEDGIDQYEYHVPVSLYKSQVIYGMELLKNDLLNDCLEYEE